MRVLAAVGAVCALSALTQAQPSAKEGSKTSAKVEKTFTGKGAQAGTGASINQPSNPAPRGFGNDECAGAIALTGSPVSAAFDSTLATTGVDGQGNAICTFFGQIGITLDEWFTWTATGTGTATITACGATGVDTKCAIYDGGCGSAVLACNDDFCGLQTQLAFAVTAGNTYTIQWGTFPGGAGGPGTLTITGPGGGGGGPPNDNCGSAQVLVGASGTVATDTTTATNDFPGTCGASGTSADTWYSWTAPAAGNVTFSYCPAEGGSSGSDTVLSFHNDCATTFSCNDDFCGLQTSLTRAMTAGQTTLIRVSAFANGTATGIMGWNQAPAVPCTDNDCCAMATVVAVPSTGNPYDLAGATNDYPGTCGATGTAVDRWFSFVAPPASSTLRVSTCGLTTGDSVLTVTDGCGGAQLVCLDDSCGLQTEITFPVTPGNTYALRIADFAGGVHAGAFDVFAPAPCVLTYPSGGGPPCCDINNDNVINSQDFFDMLVLFFASNFDFNNDMVTNSQDFFDFLVCFFTPPPGCPGPGGGFDLEGEDCGTDTNGGCNSAGFTPIDLCGDHVRGTAWASGGTRDTDWYEFNAATALALTYTGQAQFPLRLFILDANCPPAIIATSNGAECAVVTVTANVPAGITHLFAGNNTFDGNPCGALNDYWVQVCGTEIVGPANDLCANAEAISGYGTFNYDNSIAGTDGLPDALCNFFGLDDISSDLWYMWTAPAGCAFNTVLESCTLAAQDTKYAVYDGAAGCGSAAIACNDDSCGLQTSVSFAAVAGQTYLFRIGNFPGAAGGAAAFAVSCDSPCAFVPSGTPEGEDCGLDTNGGCNSIPPIYTDVPAGTTMITGLAWADLGTRDTDWYRVNLAANQTITATCDGAFDGVLFVVDGIDACTPGVPAVGNFSCGTPATVTYTAPTAGNYVIFVATANFDGLPCGADNGYNLTITY